MLYFICLLLLFMLTGQSVHGQPGHPLYEYVQRPDPSYVYQQVDQWRGNGYTTYVLNMTSLTWFDESYTSHPVWYHYLTVHVPDNVDTAFTNHALLYLSFGEWTGGVPDNGTRHVWETAIYTENTNMISASLRMIPFQPITTEDDRAPKTEDMIVAWSWMNYINGIEVNGTADPELIVFFPMVKATVRAMDTVSDFVNNLPGSTVDIQNYMLAGESKRGWTAWLAPSVDSRIVAIAPVVLSILNVTENLMHYWKSFGNWTFAFGPYWNRNLTQYLRTPELYALEEMIDPLKYADSLDIPKYMVSATSDEFFMPDDYDYYYDSLPGEKYMQYLENSGHKVSSAPGYDRHWEMLETFYIAVIKNHPRPTFTWTRYIDPVTGNGYIEVTTVETPVNVTAWKADTPLVVAPRRDFRHEMRGELGNVDTGIEWITFPATDMGSNVWRADVTKPDSGYTAFYIMLSFPYPEEGRTYVFTTQALILSFDAQNQFPFAECYADTCWGSLV